MWLARAPAAHKSAGWFAPAEERRDKAFRPPQDPAALQPPSFPPSVRDGLHDLLAWRRDVRAFRRDPLPDGMLDRLIAAACLSPSVGLSEPWRFVAGDDPARRAAVRDDYAAANAAALAEQDPSRHARYARLKLAGLDEAPVHLAVFADPDDAQGHGLGRHTMPDATGFSVAIAIHTLWLAARVEGVGLGWVSILNPDVVARICDVPERWRLVGYLCLGYPTRGEIEPELQREGWERRRTPGCRLLRR